MTTAFEEELTTAIPVLRAVARSYVLSDASADDLVQDTLVRALSHRDRYQAGTNMRAWLVTILRNAFIDQTRRTKKNQLLEDVDLDLIMSQPANQVAAIEVREVQWGLRQLRPCEREALILVYVGGLDYAEAAKSCGCAVGTIKSRVSRARDGLCTMLGRPRAADPLPALREAA